MKRVAEEFHANSPGDFLNTLAGPSSLQAGQFRALNHER